MTVYIYVKDDRVCRANRKPDVYPHVRVSSDFRVVTIFDGRGRSSVNLRNFERAFGDPRKAWLEFKSYLWALFSSLSLKSEVYGKLRDGLFEVIAEEERRRAIT